MGWYMPIGGGNVPGRVLISALMVVVFAGAFGGASARAEEGSVAVSNMILDAADQYVQTAEHTKQQSEAYRGFLNRVREESAAIKKRPPKN